MMTEVKAWQEQISIPTYGLGAPDKNPMFLEKRVYQGSSGAVYPHPVIDRVFDEKEDREYTALYLENEYLKIMLLPELGGRVQMALDKTNNYHFVYHNEVIKPALVGLTGPWISGGIEFNWPQHHRPSTFDPTDYTIEEHPDGSKTVWIGEIERMFRTKAVVGFRLHPKRAYLELDVRLSNRTSEPQTFLWWANPAVAVNDNYQSVFPPDVHAVMDHGKRDVSDFPIATGTYYKMDYSPGTDISRYKNIPVPTSYMAYHSDFNFVGCYDHGPRAGMLHVADHHVVPGKKQWTWGHSDFGRAWDRQLTDENGPYIELMCGAYTDNQPDFSWLMPGEEKRFTQIFMPYKEIGPVGNASRNGALSLSFGTGRVTCGAYATAPSNVRLELLLHDRLLSARETHLDPASPYTFEEELPEGAAQADVTFRMTAPDWTLEIKPLRRETPPIPSPASPALTPENLSSVEELFLNGQHLEQYRHATYAPEPYYNEALRRDPGDSRCNNALGLLHYRKGQFSIAERYFRKAVERLTLRNPNPYDGEALYNLGLALKMQGYTDEAFDRFFKATWNDAWQSAGCFELARIACGRGDWSDALEYCERSINKNRLNHKVRHLNIILLRKTGRLDEARSMIRQALQLDPLEFGALHEQLLIEGEGPFEKLIRGYLHNYIELALDCTHAGCYAEAAGLLRSAPGRDPMQFYYLGWIEQLAGHSDAATEAWKTASGLPTDYCFPHRIECVPALEAAIRVNPKDARAHYYLGTFRYSKRCYPEAIACWERSVELDAANPTAHRNLGLAYMNKMHDPAKARVAFETAFKLNPADARVFYELDQFYKHIGQDPKERLERLEKYDHLTALRDDLCIERLNLLNLSGRHSDALSILENRTFHPWEGGEGKVTGQYVLSLLALARQAIAANHTARAVELLERARTFPHNLGEGKLYGAQENHILYCLGLAFKQQNQPDRARELWTEASMGSNDLSSAMYYNDQPPEMIFYQGLALRALGKEADATALFQHLLDYGSKHLDDRITMDYFAVSLPDFLVFDVDLDQKNRIYCLFLQTLGALGLGKPDEAARALEQLHNEQPDHLGAYIHTQRAEQ